MSIDLSSTADMDYKPTLHEVNKFLDEEIVGEFSSRLSLFTNWVLGHRPVMLAGPRASGKTWISQRVAWLVGDTVYNLTSGSDKSAWYQAEEINKCTHLLVYELNKIPKEIIEILKDFGEGKGSEYKVVANEGGVRSIKKYRLHPRPFVFCLADEEEMSLDVQLRSRLTVIRTDDTIEQNKRVIAEQAKLAKHPVNLKKMDKTLATRLKHHVRSLPPFFKFDYKHPASEVFTSAIPTFFTDSRRDFPKYLDNTYGITRFHWKERLTALHVEGSTSNGCSSMYNICNAIGGNVEESSTVASKSLKTGSSKTLNRGRGKRRNLMFVTPSDMYLNHVIYGQTLIESSLKCSALERSMLMIIKSNTPSTRKMVQHELRRIGITLSGNMCSKHLNNLANIGYLNKAKEGIENIYEAGEFFTDFTFSIDWNKVIQRSKEVMETLYPKIADAYVERFCKNPTAVHPYTGDTIKLKDLKVEEVRPEERGLSRFLSSGTKEEVV